MGWWITLGILGLLAVLPLGVSAVYDKDGAVLKIIAGPIRITLFPRPKKEKKSKKEEKPKNKKKSTGKKKTGKKTSGQSKPAEKKKHTQKTEPAKAQDPKKDEKKSQEGGSLTDFLPLVKIVLDFLGDFKRKLRVNLLEVKLVLAGDDPCDLATNYGRAWAALGNLMPRLERFLVIQKRDIDIACDFTAAATTVRARVELTITLGRLLTAVFVFAFRAIVEFLKIIIKRKGGTDNEQKPS